MKIREILGLFLSFFVVAYVGWSVSRAVVFSHLKRKHKLGEKFNFIDWSCHPFYCLKLNIMKKN